MLPQDCSHSRLHPSCTALIHASDSGKIREREQHSTLVGEVSLELVDDFCITHEREGIVVYAHINAKFQVQPILVCDGRKIGTLPSDVEMPPA